MRTKMGLGVCLVSVALAGCVPYDDLRQRQVDEIVASGVQISLAGSEAEVTNYYFVFDGSGSMADACSGDQKFSSKIDGAKWAVSQLKGKFPPEARIGLLVFDASGFREALQLGDWNESAFLGSVTHILPWGGTPLKEAIIYGVNSLVIRRSSLAGSGERYELVIVTDGQAEGIAEAGAYAQRFQTPLSVIGLCIPGAHELKEYASRYYDAQDFSLLSRSLEGIVLEAPIPEN